MRLLHLFSNHKLTGPAEPALRLAAELQRRGHDVVFAHTPHRRASVASAAVAGSLRITTQFRLPKHFRWMALWLDMHHLGSFIDKNGIEVVHCNLLNDHVTAVHARRYCRRGRTVIVRTNHDAVGMPRWVRTRYALNGRTDALIELSRGALEEDVETFRFPRDRAFVVETAIDLDRFNPCRPLPDVRGKLGVGADDFVIGIAARIQKHRRFHVLLKAVALARRELPRLKLVIIGRGTHRQAVADRPARRLGIGDAVVFPGYLTGDEYVAALMALDASVFLVPGTDGSCRAVREAMALARPVIAARRGMLPELVEDQTTGLIVDDTPRNLADAILRLGADRDLRRGLGQAARSAALSRFDPARQAEQVEHIYRQVLSASDNV